MGSNWNLCNTDVHKSSGEDKLEPYALKSTAHFISEDLTHIFNESITPAIFPPVWKTACVFPLHKVGSKSELNNHRPISKLSCLAKILESLVNEQLKAFLHNNSILSPYQSSFRPGHGTVSATTLVLNDIDSALDKKKTLCCSFHQSNKSLQNCWPLCSALVFCYRSWDKS